MASQKCVGPARHGDDGEAQRDRLGSKISPTNTPSLDQLQAPDDAGLSDHDYFVAHPNVDHRVRLPIEGEFPARLIEQGGGLTAFIHVFIIRNSDGSPGTRARAVFYSEGGTA